MMDEGLADRLKGYAERLQNGKVLDEPGLGADLDDAAAEIERQKALLAVGPWDAWRNAEAKLAEAKDHVLHYHAEVDQWRTVVDRARAILESCTSGEMCVDRALEVLRENHEGEV